MKGEDDLPPIESRATFTDTSHCYPYCDIYGDILCEASIQRICNKKECPLKHGDLQPIGDIKEYPPATVYGFEFRHLLLAAYTVFSPRFVWAKEKYIEELFNFSEIYINKIVKHEIFNRRPGKLKVRTMKRDNIIEPTLVI